MVKGKVYKKWLYFSINKIFAIFYPSPIGRNGENTCLPFVPRPTPKALADGGPLKLLRHVLRAEALQSAKARGRDRG